MPPWVIASIVEGDGEVSAVPELLRRLRPTWIATRPIRVPRMKLPKAGVLERYLVVAEAGIQEKGGEGGVLILIDAEDDCPAELGPKLLNRARKTLGRRAVEVVLAKRMFESWLVAGEACEIRTMPQDVELCSPTPILRESLGRYKKTADQPRLTARMKIDLARSRCPSFEKLLRALDALDRGA